MNQKQANCRVERTPIELLPEKLPEWLKGLSIGRAQIIVDQLRSAISAPGTQSQGKPAVHWLTCYIEHDSGQVPPASIIAVQGSVSSDEMADTATVLHAGPLFHEPAHSDLSEKATAELRQAFDREMRSSGVSFAQWATEPNDSDSPNLHCQQYGFNQLATLQYMSGVFGGDKFQGGEKKSEFASTSVTLRAVDVGNPQALSKLAICVDQTYTDTLDCPQLNDYRSASQTLGGYQTSIAFDANRWYEAVDASGAIIGVVIMATHNEKVSELVYMALLPARRGQGHGRDLLRSVINEVQSRPCETKPQLVLAVDEKNLPAIHLYQAAGMKPMIRETVWGKHYR